MRITGGRARGIRLAAPQGSTTRPAVDSLREALFSSLGARVEGARFVDLFAGTGSYGLEAISRGATGGQFVEKDERCVRLIRKNLASVCKSTGVEAAPFHVVKLDVLKLRGFSNEKFDFVFADPPYEDLANLNLRLFQLAEELLTAGGLFIIEKPANVIFSPQGWNLMRQLGKKRRHGPSLDLWEYSNPSSPSG